MINGVSIDLLTCEQDKCEHMFVRDKYTQCHFEDNHIRRRFLEYTRVDVSTTVPETGAMCRHGYLLTQPSQSRVQVMRRREHL
jgi:hypothetical protein